MKPLEINIETWQRDSFRVPVDRAPATLPARPCGAPRARRASRSNRRFHKPCAHLDQTYFMKTNLSLATFISITALTAALSCAAQTSAGQGSPGGVPSATQPAQPPSTQTVRSMFKDYFRIQTALARDSMKNISRNAQALATAARADQAGALPPALAAEAGALAKARKLASARTAFKSLSEALIGYTKANGSLADTVYELYCPKVKAPWLQPTRVAKNPYLGLRADTATWGWTCFAVVKAEFQGRSD